MENSEIDKIVDLILEGKTYRAIALELKMPLSSLYSGIQSNAEHSARVREALQFSANTFADKAEDVLSEADSTKEEIMRAKELAQHYRWKASKRAPKVYGDKLDVTTDGDKINALPQSPIINVYQTGVKLSSSEEDIDDNKPETPTDV